MKHAWLAWFKMVLWCTHVDILCKSLGGNSLKLTSAFEICIYTNNLNYDIVPQISNCMN